MREQRTVAYRLPVVRLLPWTPGLDVGREVAVKRLKVEPLKRKLQIKTL